MIPMLVITVTVTYESERVTGKTVIFEEDTETLELLILPPHYKD